MAASILDSPVYLDGGHSSIGTITSGSDRILIMGWSAGGYSGVNDITAITVGGQSMTEISGSLASEVGTWIYALNDAGIQAMSGSTVSVTSLSTTGGATNCSFWMTIQDADQDLGNATGDTATGSGTSLSLGSTFTRVADGYTVNIGSARNAYSSSGNTLSNPAEDGYVPTGEPGGGDNQLSGGIEQSTSETVNSTFTHGSDRPLAISIANFGKAVAAGVTVTPSVGSVVFTGLAPTATRNISASASPSVGTIAFTGLAPSVGITQSTSPSVGTITFTGLAPTATRNISASASPSVGTVTFTGLAPSVSGGTLKTSPSVGVITFTGLAPTATRNISASASPAVGEIVFTGLAPTATRNISASASPSVGEIVLTGLAPTVSGGTIRITPTVGEIVFTGHAPTAFEGNNPVATPTVGTIVFTGLAPTVSGGTVHINPAVGEITFTGLAPTVTGGTTAEVLTVTTQPGVGKSHQKNQRRTLHVLPDKRIAYASRAEVVELLSYYKEQETEEIIGRKRTKRFKVKAQPATDIIAELKEERLQLQLQEEQDVFYVMKEIARLVM